MDPTQATTTQRTRHCGIRLMNVVFSDKFCDRIAQLDNTCTRTELDAKSSLNSQSLLLWKEITVEFLENTHDYNDLLLTADPRFADLDPSLITKQHDEGTLFSMWKNINTEYVKTLARFTQSGTHESSDFFAFCSGGRSLDVAYLRECLNVKPNLTPHVVKGTMLEDDDERNSLTSPTKRSACLSVASEPRKKCKVDNIQQVLQPFLDQFVQLTKAVVSSAPPKTSEVKESDSIDTINRLMATIERLQGIVDDRKSRGLDYEVYKAHMNRLFKKMEEAESAMTFN